MYDYFCKSRIFDKKCISFILQGLMVSSVMLIFISYTLCIFF